MVTNKNIKAALHRQGLCQTQAEKHDYIFASEKTRYLEQEISKLRSVIREKNKTIKQLQSLLRETHLGKASDKEQMSLETYMLKTSVKDYFAQLPVWSFDDKYLYEARYQVRLPKMSLFGPRSKSIGMLLKSAQNEACSYLKIANSKSCVLLHGGFAIDVQQGLKFTFILKDKGGNIYNCIVIYRAESGFQIISSSKLNNKKQDIHIVTILSEEIAISRVEGFISMLQKLKSKDLKITVVFVLYASIANAKIYLKVINEIQRTRSHIRIRISHQTGKFERGLARHIGTSKVVPDDAMILFADIDVSFDLQFLERCYLYTKSGKSVYFPIVFSLYNPNMIDTNDTKKCVISKKRGTWRIVGYGNLCVFKSDYFKIGGFDTNITGWGSEDSDLYNRY
eukprot:gene13741-15175_t